MEIAGGRGVRQVRTNPVRLDLSGFPVDDFGQVKALSDLIGMPWMIELSSAHGKNSADFRLGP
jgi:hypothetical protein